MRSAVTTMPNFASLDSILPISAQATSPGQGMFLALSDQDLLCPHSPGLMESIMLWLRREPIAGRSVHSCWQRACHVLGPKPTSAVRAVPVCRTCSRASEIPIVGPDGCPQRGPEPLRDASYPDGLPNLEGASLTRVLKANSTYDFVMSCSFVKTLTDRGSGQPQPSAASNTQYPFALASIIVRSVEANLRPKHTTLASSRNCLTSLAKNCPGPSCAQNHAVCRTGDMHSQTLGAGGVIASKAVAEAQIFAGYPGHCNCRSPRSSHVSSNATPELPRCPATVRTIPANSQLLRTVPLSVKMGNPGHHSAHPPASFQKSATSEQAWGVPYPPEALVDAACKAVHPKLLTAPLPEHLQKSVKLNKNMNPQEFVIF